MVRDGVYGKRRRQRFRCVAADGTFHRFTPVLPRSRAELGFCDTCDNDIAVHEGPVAARRGLYEIREIAEALRLVAQGVSYAEAARRVRGRYWGAGGKGIRKATSVEGGQTVAEWLHQFAPVLAAPLAETSWPECLVLDGTEFVHTDPRTGVAGQMFAVMAAWAYPAGDTRGRLWALAAYPSDQAIDWADFLAQLPGRPASVVCDRDLAIIGGVQRHWGRGRNAVPIHLCEHHLWANAMKALRRDGDGSYGTPLSIALRDAFHSQTEWDAFARAVNVIGGPEANKWVRHWDKRMRMQTARRASLPAHYSTGALEPRIEQVRRILESRAWTFRNRERLNLLLQLVRLHLNGHDDTTRWTSQIRVHLEANGGAASSCRRIADPVTYDVNGDRVYSLRG